MKNDKILLQVSSLNQVEIGRVLGISNFIFPLRDFSVGYKDFSFDEISHVLGNVYILANRLLTDSDIDGFLKLDIPSNVKGFIVEDTGLYMELKDKGYELFNFQNHLNNNYKTINYWLDYFSSVVLSTDITIEEVEKVLARATKPLLIYAVGYPMIMYSRRSLVSNYYQNYGLPLKKEISIADTIGTSKFKLVETAYGTACFDEKLLDIRDYLDRIDDDKIRFYIVNSFGLSDEELEKILKGQKLLNSTDGFFSKKTVFRIGDLQ